MASNRSTAVRALAVALSEHAGVTIEAYYDASQWILEWSDGPTRSTMRDAAPALAPAGLDLKAVKWRRTEQVEAVAIWMVQMAREDRLPYPPAAEAWRMLSTVEVELWKTEYPDQPRDALAAVLGSALLEASRDERWRAPDTRRMAELLVEHDGIAWLLPDPSPGEEAYDLDRALQILTARYATGQAARDWRHHLRPLPLHEALQAVLADPDPDLPPWVTLATVTVAAEHHRVTSATLDAMLSEAMRRARAAEIGQAAGGMTRQGAAQLYGRLTDPDRRRVTHTRTEPSVGPSSEPDTGPANPGTWPGTPEAATTRRLQM
jgi:hypothetical protein